MKQGAQVKKYILELLSDGKEHTTIEIREYILTQNIRLDKSSTLIRNILHNLKHENPNFINTGRGKYKLQTNNSHDNNYSELKNAIYIIEKNLQEYKHFNWITCDDLQLDIARSKVQMLINLAYKINSETSI